MSYILPNKSEKGPENKEKGYKYGRVTCSITWVTNFQFARYSSQYLLAVTGNYTQIGSANTVQSSAHFVVSLHCPILQELC